MSSSTREVPGTRQAVFAVSQRERVLASWQTRRVHDLTLDRTGARERILGVLFAGELVGTGLMARADGAFLAFIEAGHYNTAYDAALSFERDVQRQRGHASYGIIFDTFTSRTSRAGDVGYFPTAVRSGVPAREVPGSRGVSARDPNNDRR